MIHYYTLSELAAPQPRALSAIERPATFAHRTRQEHVRGHVWITGRTVHYEVTVGGVRVLYDNTGVRAWRECVLLATAGAETIRHLLVAASATFEEYEG